MVQLKPCRKKDIQFAINGSGRLPKAQKQQVPEARGGAADMEELH